MEIINTILVTFNITLAQLMGTISGGIGLGIIFCLGIYSLFHDGDAPELPGVLGAALVTIGLILL